jgi:acid phosphatase (class B)
MLRISLILVLVCLVFSPSLFAGAKSLNRDNGFECQQIVWKGQTVDLAPSAKFVLSIQRTMNPPFQLILQSITRFENTKIASIQVGFARASLQNHSRGSLTPVEYKNFGQESLLIDSPKGKILISERSKTEQTSIDESKQVDTAEFAEEPIQSLEIELPVNKFTGPMYSGVRLRFKHNDKLETLLYRNCSFSDLEVKSALGLTFIRKAIEGDEIKKVGFDIDDTLISADKNFFQIMQKAKFRTPKFWAGVNGNDQGNSTIKQSVFKILKQHRDLGHEIYAITARQPHNPKPLRAFIEKTFGIPAQSVFLEPKKTGKIKELELDIFYGDADSDMTAAQEAGIKAVRVLRSPRANYRGKYHPGHYGEPILKNSYE